ncbi:MAG: hypothetical protein JNN29_02335 [Chitinophagaceae bacterium]|nr:hypothetical protein [Chitinophagaceae bacterium]
MSYSSITRISSDHKVWQKSLEFYKDEIRTLQARLTEIATKNTSFEARQGIEHFQNQFIVQRNNIDELKHEMNHFADEVSQDVLHHAGHVNDLLVVEKKVLKEKYEDFERVMNGLRHEFNDYVAKWL